MHFTCLGFTSLSGEAVLCAIIIAGINQVYEVEVGIDSDAPINGDPNDDEYFEKNEGTNRLFPAGPKCSFGGKTVEKN